MSDPVNVLSALNGYQFADRDARSLISTVEDAASLIGLAITEPAIDTLFFNRWMTSGLLSMLSDDTVGSHDPLMLLEIDMER